MGAYTRRGNLLFDPNTKQQVGYVDLDGAEQLGSLVSGAGNVRISQAAPRWVNGGDVGIDGPMTRVSLPVPSAYQAVYGTYNTEFAYGTPIYFGNGWNGYKFWMAAAPYPTSTTGRPTTVTIATPGVLTSYLPPPIGTAVSLSTTGALPTGLATNVVYYIASTGYGDGTFQLSATPGGASIATSGTQSGSHQIWYIGGQATITIGSPGVVSCAQSPQPGTAITFSTSGALPTGIVSGNNLYVSATGWTSSSFSVSSTPGGAPITTSGTQSGAHTFALYAPKYENPYVLVSNDGAAWSQPTGILANPIADSITASSFGGGDGYFADPYIVAAPDQSKIYICWHWFSRAGTNKCTILVSESSDGKSWSTPAAISNSTSTGFQPNSVSLIPIGPSGQTGWTMIAVDTAAATQPYIYSQTSSPTPYTGWTAPGAVYSGEWTQCTATHPLTRKWWHQHTIPIEGGGLLSLATDNGSGGGTAWSLVSWDYGATWSVRQFSAYDPVTAGGPWYRPSLCAINDGGNQALQLFVSTAGWPKAPNTVNSELGQNGFYVYTAKANPKLSQDLMSRAFVRDAVNRNLASPATLVSAGLIAWDSFNRVDGAVGTADSGQTWNVVSGTWAISTNRLSCTGAGMLTIDLGVSSYDAEFRIITLNSDTMMLFGYQDTSNRIRWGNSSGQPRLERIVSGTVYSVVTNITATANDIMRVSKRGPYYALYFNDRLAYSFYDPTLASKTLVGFQFGAGAIVDNFIAYAG